MALPEDFLRELRENSNIIDVARGYIDLKRSGGTYSCCCPFHSEKTPSCHFYPATNSFFCFGCHAGGDVITFIRLIENLDYIDAVRFLAQRANMPMPEEKADGSAQLRRRLFEMNRAAGRFWHEQLFSPDGAAGAEYLRRRGLSEHTIRRFGLGWAADDYHKLHFYMRSQGFADLELEQGSLLARYENKIYDKFRNRVMFPIIDVRGNVIAFGGRITHGDGPKYLNSGDTPVFNKSRNLYFLNAARKSGENFVILVEGYMDVIALAKNGYLNTVATLGTALTKEQAKMIASNFKEVVICYDSDGAGRNATDRAIKILREHDIKISVMNLKDKKDPDEYLNAYGKTRFNNCISKRKSDMAYLMECLEEKYDVMKNDEKVSFVGEMLSYLKLIKNPVELDVYIEEMSQSTGVSSNAIYSQLGVVKAVGQRRETDVPADVTAIAQRHTAHTDDASLGRTRELLLGLLMSDKSLLTKHNLLLAEPLFESDVHKKLLTYISACADIGKMPETGDVLNLFDGDDINEISLILSLDNKADDPNKAFCDYVKIINDRLNKRRIMSLLKGGGENLEKLNKIIKNQ